MHPPNCGAHLRREGWVSATARGEGVKPRELLGVLRRLAFARAQPEVGPPPRAVHGDHPRRRHHGGLFFEQDAARRQPAPRPAAQPAAARRGAAVRLGRVRMLFHL
jgi:hypothetical protein